jgi:anti-sigma-K factor RskA
MIEAYALGLCDAQEKAELDLLRKQEPAINEAILAFEKSLEKNLQASGHVPPVGLKQSIMQQLNIAEEKTQADLAPAVQMKQATVRQLNFWRYATAACVALLIGSAVLNYNLHRAQNNQFVNLQVNNNADLVAVNLKGIDIHKICNCTLLWNKKNNEMMVMIHHLPDPNASSDFQLWAYVDGKPVSLGILDPLHKNQLATLKNIPLNATSFKVTKEKKGGSESPNMNELYLESINS